MHYLWFDCETGGRYAKINSLLTAYFAVCDRDLKVIDELYLQLKPEDISTINVTEEAMKVNGIDLQEHLANPETVTYAEGRKQLNALLVRNKIRAKRKHFMPCGHNVAFDKEFIWEQLMPQEEFETLVHYRTLDTMSGCTPLKDVGILPADVGSLTSLVEYFGIPMKEAHNARDDVLMNIEVYRSMRDMLTSKKRDMSAASNVSLLQIIEE
jgi:oligoribonuclease (3'-5' exoribonuclease)